MILLSKLMVINWNHVNVISILHKFENYSYIYHILQINIKKKMFIEITNENLI